MTGLLENKVAMVTGGGSGIGRATAATFHKDGAKVAVVDINLEAAELVKQEILDAGGDAIALEANVANEEQVATTIEKIVDHYGALHAASNNAAYGGGFKAITEWDEKEWALIQDVTLKGVWLCMKYQLPAIEQSGGGAIVNISSVGGVRGEAKMSPYASAKGGVNLLTMTAAAEYGQRGVRVNAVAPGGILTPAIKMYFDAFPQDRDATIATHAMRRLGEPEDIADAVSYLLSDRAAFITGHILNVDGGVMVNPHNL